MVAKTLYILRSVSGAGKTTLAKTLEENLPDAIAIAADDYHYDSEGNYNWKPENMHKAHQYCKAGVLESMKQCYHNIIVHNTNTTEKEIEPYLQLANKFGYKVVSLIVENRHGNHSVHDVPDNTIENQEKRLRQSIKLK
tara:strand:+ start:14372 stop:14788 length:417 start_codon:yes stop_codon:yes gene_type:complete